MIGLLQAANYTFFCMTTWQGREWVTSVMQALQMGRREESISIHLTHGIMHA